MEGRFYGRLQPCIYQGVPHFHKQVKSVGSEHKASFSLNVSHLYVCVLFYIKFYVR